MTILVIEDSRLLRLAITRILVKAGYQVISVGDGREGLQRAHDLCPDMILLDMMLPTLEGTSLLRQLKKDLSTKAIPVLVLSGLSQKNGQKLLADGAAGYLEKSKLDFEGEGSSLLSMLKSLLGVSSVAAVRPSESIA
jgi:CheY-like chemotaxis protein